MTHDDRKLCKMQVEVEVVGILIFHKLFTRKQKPITSWANNFGIVETSQFAQTARQSTLDVRQTHLVSPNKFDISLPFGLASHSRVIFVWLKYFISNKKQNGRGSLYR